MLGKIHSHITVTYTGVVNESEKGSADSSLAVTTEGEITVGHRTISVHIYLLSAQMR